MAPRLALRTASEPTRTNLCSPTIDLLSLARRACIHPRSVAGARRRERVALDPGRDCVDERVVLRNQPRTRLPEPPGTDPPRPGKSLGGTRVRTTVAGIRSILAGRSVVGAMPGVAGLCACLARRRLAGQLESRPRPRLASTGSRKPMRLRLLHQPRCPEIAVDARNRSRGHGGGAGPCARRADPCRRVPLVHEPGDQRTSRRIP